MFTSNLKAIVGGTGLVLSLVLPGTAAATNLTLFKTVFDTDFTSAGVGGMRGNGTGNITLSGVSGTVTEAYLYWHGPNNNPDNNANAAVNFAGNNITGTFLGVSSDNCWGFSNSLAYRANVSSLVSGNGTFALSNFVKNGADINGASLIVFFNDGTTANNRDVVMFDGNDSNINNPFDAPGWNITLAGINYSSGTASAQFHVADGQPFNDAALIANATTIAPAGAVFNGLTVPNAGFNETLWDIRDFDVTSLLAPGPNSLNISTGVASDCLACTLIALSLPAGAAPPPPPPPVPEPASLVLMGLGLVGLGVARRRKA